MPRGEEGTYCHIKLSTPPSRLSTFYPPTNCHPPLINIITTLINNLPTLILRGIILIHRQIVRGHLNNSPYICGMIRTNTNLERLTHKDIRKIVNLTIKYCEVHLGVNGRRGQSGVMVMNQSPNADEKRYGEYCPDYHMMRLFKNHITNVRCLIETTIHEYTHTLQGVKTNYAKLYEKHGYNNHPYEIEAVKNESLINEVWPTIRKKLTKMKLD